jgi:hypothetical protein
MVAKLVLALIAIVLIVGIATIAAFLYFREKEQHRHETEMRRLERDEKLFDSEFGEQDSIDRQLEREEE